MPQTQERPAALRHRGAFLCGHFCGYCSFVPRNLLIYMAIWRRLSLANNQRWASRAIFWLSFLVDKALHNTVRHPVALTHAF